MPRDRIRHAAAGLALLGIEGAHVAAGVAVFMAQAAVVPAWMARVFAVHAVETVRREWRA